MTLINARELAVFISCNNLSETVLGEIMDAVPVAIYMTDAQGRLTYFNSAAAKLSGRRPEIGTDQWCVTWKIFLSDGTPLPHDQCPMAVALTGDKVPAGMECIAERPDGTRFWFTPYPAVLRDAEGRIVGGINVLIDITERKNAQREVSEQFRAIVETTPECVKVVAPDGTLLFMNPPGLEMVGASCPEAVVGKSVYNVIAPEDQERFREFNQMICGGQRGSLEFGIVGPKGERRHMETHAAPLQHADGITVHLAVSHDVTERKRAESSSFLLSAVVDSSDDAIISKNLDGVITSWNKSAQRLFGYTAEEAIGQTVASLLIPEDRQEEEPDILARLRRGERVDHFETVRRRKDDSLIDLSLTISPVRNREGVIIGASKIARDITESKRIRAKLMESEARFRQLADAMPQIVWTARPDGFVDYFNERWCEFTGFGRDAYGEANWERILHPEDLQRTRETWYAAVSSRERYNIEHRFFDQRENRWRWFMGRALPVPDAAGKVVKWFGTSTDIDDQKRVEDQLRRANQDLEQFAFSASHDLQEPLRSIKIYSELLMKRHAHKLDGEALKFMSFLRNGATRMEILVRDLLTYTQATKFDEPPKVTDANEALKTALANLSGAIMETGAHVTNGPLPLLPVNGTHLQQLFQNLIGNAIKYRSPERSPAVHSKPSGRRTIGFSRWPITAWASILIIRRASLGCSSVCIVAMNTQEPVLDWPFVGESWTGIRGVSGSNPNPDEDQPSASPSPSEKASAASHSHVLIVDDNESDVFLIQEAIEATRLSLTLHVAKDGEQAIRFFDRADAQADTPCPALVILDINLPKKQGGDVLKHMRLSGRCADALVIVVSTSDSMQDREQMRNLGADGYFHKPSAYEEFMKLGDVVKTLLSGIPPLGESTGRA